MRRYPYQRFLQYLVSRKACLNDALCRLGLPEVGKDWQVECINELLLPAPFSVMRYLDADQSAELIIKVGFLDWAEEIGIRELWAIQREFGGKPAGPSLDAAMQIFVNPHARTMMGMFLLSEMTDKDASEIVGRKFDLAIDKEALEIYKRIFWDITQVKRDEWSGFIGELKTTDEQHFIGLGLGSPSAVETWRYIEEESGLTPDRVLRRVMNSAHDRYEACLRQIDPETAGARMWADLAMKAITTLGTHKKAMGADEVGELTPSEFTNMFSVQIEKVHHVSLADLQGEVSEGDNATGG